MKKFLSVSLLVVLMSFVFPIKTFAAGGVYASGGGTKTAGSNFSVTVTASGASFNAVEGTISVSGPVSVVSFSAGSAVWMTTPGNGKHFVGMLTSPASSLRIATIILKGTKVGSGSVSVGSVRLALSGSSVGTGAGGTSFSISRAPTPPGGITITSSTHPDQAQKYEATSATLAWTAPANGATGYSYVWDQKADTVPASTVNTTTTTASFDKLVIGTYYFHIKAQNGDGWGNATHFQVNIKEPENLINDKLAKPKNIKISKAATFKNIIKDGTVQGIVIKGTIATKAVMDKYNTLGDPATIEDPILKAKAELYQANIILTPELTLPEGKSLSVKPDKNGNFRLLIDYPIRASSYKLTVQGQRAKILTPLCSDIFFEVAQAKGGRVSILTKNDENIPVPPKPKLITPLRIAYGEAGLILIILLLFLIGKFAKSKGRSPKPVKENKKEGTDTKPDKKKDTFDWDIN